MYSAPLKLGYLALAAANLTDPSFPIPLGLGDYCDVEVATCSTGLDCVTVSPEAGIAHSEFSGVCMQGTGVDEYCGNEIYCADGNTFCDWRLKMCRTTGRIGTPCNTDGSCTEGHCRLPQDQQFDSVSAFCKDLELSEKNIAALDKKRASCEEDNLDRPVQLDCDVDYGESCKTFSPICQYETTGEQPGQCTAVVHRCEDCNSLTEGVKECCRKLANSLSLPSGWTCSSHDDYCMQIPADEHGWCEEGDNDHIRAGLSISALLVVFLLHH